MANGIGRSEVIFYAHDAGAFETIKPVYERFRTDYGNTARFYCSGPAEKFCPECGLGLVDIEAVLSSLIQKGQIGALVSGRSWENDSELNIIDMCKKEEILTFSILEYWINYRKAYKSNPERVMYPDYYIMMDDIAKHEAIVEGVPPDIIRVLGQPGLDKWVSKRKPEKKEYKAHKIEVKILFLSQPLSKLYGNELGYTEYEAAEDCIKAAETVGGIEVSAKFHQKDDAALIEKYKPYEINMDLSEIFSGVDLVIGMSSTALLYASLIGVQSISYQPGLKQEDKCITSKLGATKTITSFDELVTELISFKTGNFNSFDRRRIEEYLWADGNSTNRVFDFIRNELTNRAILRR